MQIKQSLKHSLLNSFVILIILFCTFSCNKGNNEGTIEYNIEFKEEERKTNGIIDLLPNKMKYYFKNKGAVSEISAMGVFRTAYISDFQKKNNTIVFHFMSTNNYCTTLFGEKTIGFDPMPGIQLQETGETKDIKGIKAYKVHITFKDGKTEPYDVWYTKDFKVHNPNWHTPYKDINGVLLDFRIKMKGISMHLTLDSFTEEEVDVTKFEVKKTYKKVSPKEMDKIFDEHLHMF